MKLTWFGGTTLRVHIGGSMLVVDAHGAPAGIDPAELTSGADRLVRLEGELEEADVRSWRPRPVGRLLDEAEPAAVECWSVGAGALVVDAPGESPLLLLAGAVPELGRWVDRAIVVLLGADGTERGLSLVSAAQPRLLALGLDDRELDRAFAALPGRLDGTGLVALERGLALEV